MMTFGKVYISNLKIFDVLPTLWFPLFIIASSMEGYVCNK